MVVRVRVRVRNRASVRVRGRARARNRASVRVRVRVRIMIMIMISVRGYAYPKGGDDMSMSEATIWRRLIIERLYESLGTVYAFAGGGHVYPM